MSQDLAAHACRSEPITGLIKAGLHEVVVNERTLEVIKQRKEKLPDRPLIRISSTFFWHLSSDIDLKPIPELKERADTLRTLNHEEPEEYPAMKVGEQVQLCVNDFRMRIDPNDHIVNYVISLSWHD